MQGGGCANTGEIMGVVQHEFGHGITERHPRRSQGTQGIGEGNSDILANLMTLESIIGRGFYLNHCTTGIRELAEQPALPGGRGRPGDPRRRAGHRRVPLGRDAVLISPTDRPRGG